MSEPTYQIVFRGKILSGHTRDEVRTRLAAMFRTEPARIDALLDAPKTVLKTGLSKDAASRYQEALRQAGIMVAAVAESPAAPVATAPGTPSAPAGPNPAAAGQSPAAAAGTLQPAPAPADAGLTLAPPGERILPERAPLRREFDTSGLSLAEPGAILGSHHDAPPPPLALDHLSLAADEGPVDPTPRPPPRHIDTSALVLSERPPEAEKPMTELQKLLASDPGF